MNELIEIDEYKDFPPDDAIMEIAELAPHLSKQERLYVYWRSLALPPKEAMGKAGYTSTAWRAIETRPKIRNALQDLNEKLEPEYRISQKKVIAILMEAIEIARRKDQAKNMIDGAVALANIAGVSAPTRFQATLSHNVSSYNRMAPDNQMSRPQLEQIMGLDRMLPHIAPPLEAEYEHVKDII